MNNPVARRALLALAHPLSIAALLVLLLNDHWWKRVAPSWLTGKLSDVAGLVFVPFVLLVLLAYLLPTRYRKHEHGLGLLALFMVGGAFALIKTIPAVRAGAAQLFEAIFGWPIIIYVDPTDLLTLPALLVAWHVWQQSATPANLPRRGWVLLTLGALASVATSGPYPNLGVYCLHQVGQSVVAHSSSGSFISEDEGNTWRLAITSESIAENCTPFRTDIWELVDSSRANVRYRFTPNQLIERSTDGGKTWQIELTPATTEAQMVYYRNIRPEIVSLKGVPVTDTEPYDAVMARSTGTLIVAMGQEGVAVQTSIGHWRYIAVGPYARVELNRADNLLPVLRGELLSAMVLLLLSLTTLIRSHFRSWRTLFLFAAWIFWAGRLIVLPHDSFTINGFDLGLWFGLVFPGLVAMLLGIMDAASVLVTSRRPFGLLSALTFGTAGLFLIPYWLWSQGSIPQYQTATFFALALVIILVLTGRQMIDVSPAQSAAVLASSDKSQSE